MGTFRVTSAVAERLVLQLQGVAGSSSGGNPLSSGSSSTSISDTLRIGARTYSTAVQNVNSVIAATGLAQSTLEDLLSLTDKMIGVVEESSKSSTPSPQRTRYNRQFREYVDQFERIVENAELGDIDYLSKEGLAELYRRIGLDEDRSNAIAELFSNFSLYKGEPELSNSKIKGPRPVNMPITTESTTTYSTTYGEFAGGGNVQTGVIAFDTSVKPVDFNNDGNLDIVTSDDTQTLGIALGIGDGTFSAASSVPIFGVGSKASGIDVADFDGDGFADVATADYNGGNIQIILGNGDGTFDISTLLTAANPGGIVTGDFDEDGDQDLFVTETNSAQVRFFRNDGGMTFTDAGTNAVLGGGQISYIDSTDLDGDGNLDLMAGNWGGEVSILYGDGAGNFTAASNAHGLGSVSVARYGDVDNDGDTDLLGIDNSGNIQIALQTSSRTFANAGSVSMGVYRWPTNIEDFNGDGFGDFAVHSQSNPSFFEVYLGNGDGSFLAPVSYADGQNSVAAGVARAWDLNNDGYADLVGVNYGTGRVTSLVNGVSTGSTTTTTRALHADEFAEIFDSRKDLRNRGDGYKLLVDLKALRKQLQDNIANLDDALSLLEKNVALVRATGLAMLEMADQVKSDAEAADIAEQLAKLIRDKAPNAMSQAENLDPLTVAALAASQSD